MNSTAFHIRGLTPLLMHNGQLVDPLNEHTQAVAAASSKRNKTLDDHIELSRLEWTGGLYVDEKGRPCLPGEVLEGCLVDGAKKYKLGKVAKGALIVDGNFPVIFDGPKSIDGLWKHGGFLKRAAVRVQTARVIRSRPIFPEWSCKFLVSWDPTMIKDERQLVDIVESAGQSGVCEWRPKFGRFEVVQ